MTAGVRPHSDAGFTLIEMLVSLVIFALVGLAGFTMLDTILRVNTATEGRLERLDAIDRALLLMRRDLGAADPSSVVGDAAALRLRRPGAGGPGVLDVRYAISDGALQRRIIRVTGAEQSAPLDQVVLEQISQAQWRFLDTAGEWRDARNQGEAAARAVDIRLTLAAPEGAAPPEVNRVIELTAPWSRP